MRPSGTKEILSVKIHFKKARKLGGDIAKRTEAERTNISNGNWKNAIHLQWNFCRTKMRPGCFTT